MMDLFAILETLWRHKRVFATVLLLTFIGMFYVVVIRPPSYQAEANVLLIYPPTPPTAFEIAQDHSLAKANNPYANLGNETYLADVMSTLLSSQASQQSLEAEGVPPGYTVTVDTSAGASGQTVAPPALDITGVGSTSQDAIQNTKLIAHTVDTDLRQLQQRQHVQGNVMITAVDYVTPTTAVKSSTGKLKMAVGIAAIGFIVLLVAVSLADGLEQRRSDTPRRGRPAGPILGARQEPVNTPAGKHTSERRPQYAEPPWNGTDDSRSVGSGPWPGVQQYGDGGQRDGSA